MNFVFPNEEWEIADENKRGWSISHLNKAESIYQSFPSSSLMIIDHGYLIAAWGDLDKKIKISSVRKSILATLFGILLQETPFDLDASLADLKLDDEPSLSNIEKQASIRQILQSRSGVYHDYVGGSPRMRLDQPKPGAHLPGTHWYYNNWDFNCAGALFEKIFSTSIADAFIKYLAKPLEMQDFNKEDFYYFPERYPKPGQAPSLFPAYHFRMTTRDMARLACLYSAGGCWQGKQIVPESWMQEMTRVYSSAFSKICPVKNSGYGYFWWINSWLDIIEPNYSAKGNLGKYIIVFPKKKLAIICQVHVEAPDDSKQETAKSYSRFASIPDSKMSTLLNILLAAYPK